jgi:hypothetical protein
MRITRNAGATPDMSRALARRKPPGFNPCAMACAAVAPSSFSISVFFSVCQNAPLGHLPLTNIKVLVGDSTLDRFREEKR